MLEFINTYKSFLEKIVIHPISNFNTYLNGMNKSIPDKLFFFNEIKPDLIVDFGCADGSILDNIHKSYPNIKLIGYDIDKEMINKASIKVPQSTITDNWNDIISVVSNYENSTLLLSSVIHEIYSYSSGIEIKKFWNDKVFSGIFKYIVIRDMIPSVSLQKKDFLKFKDDAKKINKYANKKQLFDFENIWGLIDNDYRTLIHFLLKYTYIDNWDRELRENYLPVSLETLYKKIPFNYKIKYINTYIFEPIQKRVMNDFGIILTNNTHAKIIIEKI